MKSPPPPTNLHLFVTQFFLRKCKIINYYKTMLRVPKSHRHVDLHHIGRVVKGNLHRVTFPKRSSLKRFLSESAAFSLLALRSYRLKSTRINTTQISSVTATEEARGAHLRLPRGRCSRKRIWACVLSRRWTGAVPAEEG